MIINDNLEKLEFYNYNKHYNYKNELLASHLDDDLIMMYDELGFLEGKPKWKYAIEEPPKSLLIMDDVLGSPAILQSSGLTQIATLNRHIAPLSSNYKGRSACGLAVIILSQSYKMQN